ncbi:phage tail tape measure protein [Pseudomonas alloputida]|uniref:Phage tail tape measure protein domain-containing protein n=1 Tax=Pseudomonas putida TaxID=303 RepID=A0A1L7N5W8_PSEPU|nr:MULTISPECIES: phage tail tape measure protein [Pseudomonas]MCE0890587.1 phage tail tape measure protein [Pseudomonas alloputida]MCE0919849.1 phage tail tape measure protein [Pseudomonas alloputida]MCE1046170.1 phage tail tape measure protein [Pseudomonas alloputida]MCE1092710.1 phage tail tape measure protein [Pseudomonas alloputida]MCE1126454.1 phage tail tape measure protein [Pseudomonas alloputida]
MANDLRLRLLLDTVDKATAPLRQINKGGQETARALKATRDRLKELNAQQKDVGAWRQQNAQARQTAQALDAARAKVKEMGRAMSAVNAPTKQMTAEFQAAIRATNELKQQQKAVQETLRGLQRRLGEAGIDTRKLNQHNAALRQQMAQTNTTIEQQEAQLKRLAAAQRKAAEAKERLEKAQGRAGKMAGAGAAGIAAGVGAGMAGAALIAPQLEVRHQGSMIAAQSGESPDRANQYTQIVRDIRTDGVSSNIDEIGVAVSAAKSTLGVLGDVSDKELDGAARKALNLAQVMGTDVAEAMQMVGIMLQNKLAKSSDEAFDLVTAGMQKMSSQMRGELPEILHEYSTFFRGMGYSGEEAMSLLVKQAAQGKFALDKTGDAIKEFSLLGSNMSKSSQEAYASIGLNAQKMSSAVAKGGPDARQALMKTAGALLRIKDPAERANAAIALFGTPLEELAVDQIPSFLKALSEGTTALGDVTGAADKMGKTFRDNLSGDLDRLSGTWSAMIGSLMDGQNGPLRDLVQTITSIVSAARAWIEANPELAASLAKGAAAVAVLVTGMGTLTVAMASLLGPFALARYGMAMFAIKGGAILPVVGKLVGVLSGALLTAIRGVSIALWGLAANPVALAIAATVAALAGAAYLLYQNWDQVKAYFAGAWTEIKAGFTGAITGIMNGLANFNPLAAISAAFAGVLSYLGIDLPSRFTEFGGMIVNGLVNGLTAGLGAVKDAVTSIGSSAIGWFKEKLGIHSPSRVFAELGGFTTEGLAQGLNNGAQGPMDAVAKMGQQLSKAGSFKLKAAALQVDNADPTDSVHESLKITKAAQAPAIEALAQVPRPSVPLPLKVEVPPVTPITGGPAASADTAPLVAALAGMNQTLTRADDIGGEQRPPVTLPLAVTASPIAPGEHVCEPAPEQSELIAALAGINRVLANGTENTPAVPQLPVVQPVAAGAFPSGPSTNGPIQETEPSWVIAALTTVGRMLVRGLDTARPDASHQLVPEGHTGDDSQNAPKPTVFKVPTNADSQDVSLTALSRMLDKTRGVEAKPVAQQTPVAQVQAASEVGDATNAGSSFTEGLRALTDALAPRNLWPAPVQEVRSLPADQKTQAVQPIYPDPTAGLSANLALGLTVGTKSLVGALTAVTLQLAHAGGVDARPVVPPPPTVQASSADPQSITPVTVTVDRRPPIAAAPPITYDSHDIIHISIPTSPGMDPQVIARAVSAELDRRDRVKSARQRSSLTDLE